MPLSAAAHPFSSPARPLLVALALALAIPVILCAAGENRFDGTWDTMLSCENTAGALGYSFKFPATVKEGVLFAEKGNKGRPGWLELYGKIGEDGSAKIYADGLVGASDVAVGHRPAGTKYGYNIEAKFSDDTGTGKRVEGRPCSVTFTKTGKRSAK